MSSATELAAWLNGIPTGGPNSDGRYPLTYADGLTYLVYCPAAQALNPALSEEPIEVFANTATNAAATATAESAEAQQASVDAQTYAANAAASAAAADVSEANALSYASGAATSSIAAGNHAANAEANFLDAANSSLAAQASASAALTSANNAASSAAAAAASAGVIPAGGSVGQVIKKSGAGDYITAWATLVKGDVGLGNVDNTSDANKPISTATQTALNGKEPSIAAGTTAQYRRGDKSWQTLDKAAVGLSNVDNTSDSAKPISTATQTALNLKANLAGANTFTGAMIVDSGELLFKNGPNPWAGMSFDFNAGTLGYLYFAEATVPKFEIDVDANTMTIAAYPAGSWAIAATLSRTTRIFNFSMTPTVAGVSVATFTGGTFTGDITINRGATAGGLFLDSTAGVVSDLRFYTGGSLRWLIRRDATAESGGNVGSDLSFGARTDAGGALYSVLYLTRSTGMVKAYRFSIEAADNTGGVTQPRVFVQSGDPGAKAADGDLWVW